MACGYARPHGVSVSAPDFGDLVKITAIASAEFGTNPIHRAVWHTLERASATNVEVHLMALTSEHPKVETIQAVLGSEDSKREGNIGKQGAPEPLGEAAAEPLGEVTWYLYGWSEFAVQQGKVVAVRVSGRAFRRAPERAYSDQELERTRKRLEERRRNEDRSDN